MKSLTYPQIARLVTTYNFHEATPADLAALSVDSDTSLVMEFKIGFDEADMFVFENENGVNIFIQCGENSFQRHAYQSFDKMMFEIRVILRANDNMLEFVETLERFDFEPYAN